LIPLKNEKLAELMFILHWFLSNKYAFGDAVGQGADRPAVCFDALVETAPYSPFNCGVIIFLISGTILLFVLSQNSG
jgi:hypothetical protein